MPSFFITATGTAIGKTFITCTLLHQLKARGKTVCALKPVISGWDETDSQCDTLRLLAASGIPPSEEHIQALSPWRLTAPLSPDMAASREGRSLSLPEIVSFCRQKREEEICLIEGVGGVMVPLNERHTTLDWMAELRFPALLVTGSYLGSLSHTLTALEALSHRDIPLQAVIVNETPGSTVSLPETCRSLARFTAAPIMPFPYAPSGWEDGVELSRLLSA